MLNSEHKRNIDALRDLLVGKIPNPQGQVQQITLALIYKFMSDIDNEQAGIFEHASFFDGNFAKYKWQEIMNPRLGAQERLNIYAEGIEKMHENPKVPQLFRNIFKHAFLPFRDPGILDRFLKQINEFHYEHSEDLGDAFEYLLSCLASAGDAGMFRTPRHIIDFIVSVVDPQFGETILDPACGTAGFLVSAFKHIVAKNPQAKNKIAELSPKFVGYDISPDMVQLALVNLYLHQFPDPKIFEYDTLTYEDRRGEKFDVVLANPPFMSPKGGIQPHNRFSVKSNRSEVLFVDYMMDHLKSTGKAGIIVPEGIIFKSDTACKKLRKKMIEEDHLWAVVSLPSGVFQPYAGVKTSILLFDKAIGGKTEKILFVKVNNDGYDLGAQRRPIDKNDLPKVFEILNSYKDAIKNDKIPNIEGEGILLVDESKVAETGDYNLSMERYKESGVMDINWPMVELGDIFDYEQPTNYIVESVDYSDNYKTPVLTAGKSFILGYTNEEKGIFPSNKLPVIIFDDFTTATQFVDFQFKVKSSAMKILNVKKDVADIKYVYYVMQNIKFPFTEHKRYWISQYSKIKIPLPPLPIQEQIVAELDRYQKIIDGAKMVVDNWKPVIDIDPKWELIPLKDVCDFQNGYAFKSGDLLEEKKEGTYPVIKIGNILKNGSIDVDDVQYYPYEQGLKRFEINVGDILIAMTGATVGKVAISEKDKMYLNQRCGILRSKKDRCLQEYLFVVMGELFYDFCQKNAGGGAQGNISPSQILEFQIPLPSIEIQKVILAEVKKQQDAIEVNNGLSQVFQHMIQKRIAKLWGEEKSSD